MLCLAASSRSLMERTHAYTDIPYDLNVNTHAHTTGECALQIKNMLIKQEQLQAFRVLGERFEKTPRR